MDKLNHLGWVAQRSYEVAGVQFGVRTNSDACAAWLDETFGAYGVDEEAAPYYSLSFAGEKPTGVGKPYHILYEESRQLVRSHDLRTLAEVLIGQFEHVAARDRDDVVFLDAAALRLGDVLALVPPIIPPYLVTLSRRLVERKGLRLPGATYVALDGAGNVVPVRSTLDLPADAVDRLADLAPHDRREQLARVEEPQRPDAVCFIGLAEEPVQQYSKGHATYLLATRCLNLERMGASGIQAVARLARDVPCYEVRSMNARQTLDTLAELLGSHARGSARATSAALAASPT